QDPQIRRLRRHPPAVCYWKVAAGKAARGVRRAARPIADTRRGMTVVINGLDELRDRAGQHLGYSDWFEVSQDRINRFADATDDHQWIHVDVERAKSGPFGGPI